MATGETVTLAQLLEQLMPKYASFVLSAIAGWLLGRLCSKLDLRNTGFWWHRKLLWPYVGGMRLLDGRSGVVWLWRVHFVWRLH